MIISKKVQGENICCQIQDARGLLCLASFRRANYSSSGKRMYSYDKNFSPKYKPYCEPEISKDLGRIVRKFCSGKISLEELWCEYHNPTVQAEIEEAKKILEQHKPR